MMKRSLELDVVLPYCCDCVRKQRQMWLDRVGSRWCELSGMVHLASSTRHSHPREANCFLQTVLQQ